MQSALVQCRNNLKRAGDLEGLAAALSVQTTKALDTSDLLRSCIVHAVSAFDHFIHEVTRIGMLEIAACQRPAPPAYKKFHISLGSLQMLVSASQSDRLAWLDAEIRSSMGWKSFQDPDKAAEAIRNISSKDLWREVGRKLSCQDVKSRIKLIVDRRNKIAHEADLDPTVPGMRWPIDAAMVIETLNFLDAVAEAIVEIVTSP